MGRLVRALSSVVIAFALHLAAEPAAAEPLRVFAAASLTDAFEGAAAAFRADAPGAEVELHFAASSALVAQLRDGAPADVIATADEVTMATLRDGGLLAGAPVVFAYGRLVIVVERGNPKGVRGLADLARKDLLVVLAAPEVPAGRYAGELLSRAGVRVAPRSLEANGRAVVTKVALGEADAGIAYHGDAVAAAGKVVGIEVPEAADLPVRYPIATLAASRAPDAAKAFVALLLSERGAAILRRHGLEPASVGGAP